MGNDLGTNSDLNKMDINIDFDDIGEPKKSS